MLKKTRDKQENIFFHLAGKTREHRLKVQIVFGAEIEKERNQFGKQIKCKEGKSGVIKAWAAAGVLDGKFPAHIVRAAKETGQKPSGFDFHHELPLSCGGTNASENVYLIDRALHEWLHKNVWDIVYKKAREEVGFKNKRVFVLLPKAPKVITWRDRFLFLTRADREAWKTEKSDKMRKQSKRALFEEHVCFCLALLGILSMPKVWEEGRAKGLW